MTGRWQTAGLAAGILLISGCASSNVALAPGDAGGSPGSVAVLDPATETEISVIDKAGSVANVSGRSVSVIAMDQKAFDARYAELFASLPKAPRGFTLYFKENSTDPTDASAADLPDIFEEIGKRPGADIQITGHTDTVGSDEVNDGLSLRRAAEITSYLFTLGLDKTIVRLAGRGERELKEPTADNVSSAINRRVEVLVR
jgi:OmpA-OmpF porin, OOP family